MSPSKQHIANDILHYMKTNHENMLQLLKDMVAIESPSNNKQALNNILEFIKNKWDELGFYSIRVSGKNTGGYLYARPKIREKNKPLQLLIGHCDTVWPIDTISDIPITQLDSKLTGPGVFDMKQV